MISHPALQEIQDRLNLVDVVGGYITLKRAGRVFKGLCPFHPEKTPSFVVYPEKQFFICYGCGAGGDMLSFVMKHEHLEFPEAVELLAQKAGVPVPQLGSKSASTAEHAPLYKVNEWACKVYRELLGKPEAKAARAYLEKRGLEPAEWERFQLGFAPDKWDHLIKAGEKEGFSAALLEEAGLAIRKEEGGSYDRFRNRVMFPIWDSRGRVIAFSGRQLEADPKSPKYMNSPETKLYVKGKTLYGLHLAAPQVREQDYCIIVEGNLDMVTPSSRGFKNIVASMGTALTEQQVRLIKRLTRNVVIGYDGDAAGQAATLRGLELFLQAEMRVRVASLPGGTDPDSLVREQGPEAFARALKESKELFDYKLGLLTRQHDAKQLEGRMAVCQEMLPTIKKVPNAIQKGDYIRRLSQSLGVAEELLWKELERVKLQPGEWKPAAIGPAPAKAAPLSPEEVLAGLMLEDPSRISELDGRLELERVRDASARDVIERLMNDWRDGNPAASAQEACKKFQRAPGEWDGRMARWLAEADAVEDKERAIDELVARIQARGLQESLDTLRVALRKAEELGDEKETNRLIMEISRLIKLQATRQIN